MKIKIAFVMPSLEGGGAERVTINIINNLDKNRFEPILILGKNEGKLKETLDPKIKIFDLRVERMSRSFTGLMEVLKKEKPNIIFSVMGYVNIICTITNLLMGSKHSLILTEHNTVSMEFQKNPGIMTKIQTKLKKILYPKADKVICVSNGVKIDLERFLNTRLGNAAVIYNPVLSEDFSQNIKEANHEWLSDKNFVLVTAGRLVVEKGHPDLIAAVDELVNKRQEKDIKLLILGEGPEKNKIKKSIQKYGLEDNIQLMGFQKNVKGFFLKSQAFVLSSIYEGLPTVLIEAMGLKLPVISTRCPSGPEEIILKESQGILVPVNDPKSIAEAVLKLKNNEYFRLSLGEEGFKRSFDFKIRKIVSEYEDLFATVLDIH